jgi:hypothetical protein
MRYVIEWTGGVTTVSADSVKTDHGGAVHIQERGGPSADGSWGLEDGQEVQRGP